MSEKRTLSGERYPLSTLGDGTVTNKWKPARATGRSEIRSRSLYTVSILFLLTHEELMFFKSLLAVIVGGAVGCVIRWLLAVRLNTLFPNLPPGTLIVNLTGGFIIGAAMAWFLRHPHIDPVWKLLITTGLCGGMTTFSTFSAEVFTLLQSGNYFWAFASMLIHVTGAVMMTAAGFYLVTIAG